MQIYVLTFQLLVFVLYVGYIYRKFGVLTSISASFYKLQPSGKAGLFTLFCFLLGFPMFMYATTAPGAFFLSMMLCFTGAATDYEEKTTNIVHFTGAAFGIIGAVIGISIQFWPFYWLFFILGWRIAYIWMSHTPEREEKVVWYTEVYAFIVIIASLYYYYI